MNDSLSSWLETAVEASHVAGQWALSNRVRRQEVVEKTAHDVKLQLDRECQAHAISVIRSRFPSHGILGEEGAEFGQPGEPVWIIDPIDGTVNYFHGLPLWCSSVAVQYQDHIVAGAVFAPDMNELYSASCEGPAFCNGTPLAPSAVTELKDALILTGLSKHIQTNPAAFELLKELTLLSQKVRVQGAAALDICHVAGGRADGYVETGIYLWDIAAAGLIAEQAGAFARIVERMTEVRYRYVCANPFIAEELLALLDRFPSGSEPA